MSECDNCGRHVSCVKEVNSFMGDTAQCCRCRYWADADGCCDECRPEEMERAEAFARSVPKEEA